MPGLPCRCRQRSSAGQQVAERGEQVVVAAGAGLQDRDAGRGVRDEQVQQAVARPATNAAQSSVRSSTTSRSPVRYSRVSESTPPILPRRSGHLCQALASSGRPGTCGHCPRVDRALVGTVLGSTRGLLGLHGRVGTASSCPVSSLTVPRPLGRHVQMPPTVRYPPARSQSAPHCPVDPQTGWESGVRPRRGEATVAGGEGLGRGVPVTVRREEQPQARVVARRVSRAGGPRRSPRPAGCPSYGEAGRCRAARPERSHLGVPQRRLVGDPHRAVLEGVHGVLVADRRVVRPAL